MISGVVPLYVLVGLFFWQLLLVLPYDSFASHIGILA